MTTNLDAATLHELLRAIDVPESAYEKAESRYNDLGEWFERAESKCSSFSPHIYPQGSFRLGTVIRPVGANGDYDLDLGCRLREGINKATCTQKQLKLLVGSDLEAYRQARNIQQKLEAKHRCWRLVYADDLSFHMDVVPSIPEEQSGRTLIKEAMVRHGLQDTLAENVSGHIGSITDDRLPNYDTISPLWRVSNSDGYAIWFESRMKLAQPILEKRAAAQIDKLKAWKWKSPLQQVVQLLKWHRDHMFQKNPDSKPISVIITTLAGHAYNGEEGVETALAAILDRMDQFINDTIPRVPNPINPSEDFADKWPDPAYRHLELEKNFRAWLAKARENFKTIATSVDPILLEKTAKESFGTSLPERGKELRKRAALMEKAEQLKTGARTNAGGIVGTAGVSNLPHKFYGEEPIHPEK